MADIKDLGIFSKNKGLDAIKRKSQNKKVDETSSTIVVKPIVKPEDNQRTLTSETKKSNPQRVINKPTRKKKGNVGAPIRNFDRVYSASQPVKLSALLNGTARSLTEKYMTSDTKDEILRKALNDYVKHNLTKEDKHDLLNDVAKELTLFREKHPTVEQISEDGQIVQTVEEIEEETLKALKTSWGL